MRRLLAILLLTLLAATAFAVRSALAVLLLVLLVICAASARAVTLAELGCVPNDPKFDNGPVITAAIAAGKVTGPIVCDAGAWWFQTPAELGPTGGIAFVGAGYEQWLGSENSYIKRHSASCRFMGRQIFKLHGVGLRVQGINFCNGYYRRSDFDWDGSTAISVFCVPTGPPAGKLYLDQVSFNGYGRAMWLEEGNHCDNCGGSWIWVQSCGSFLRCDEPQGNEFDFQQVHVVGYSRVVFDMPAGGVLRVGTLGLMNGGLILRTGQGTGGTNTCFFRFAQIKIDNGSADKWRLVECEGPIDLYARGLVGKGARPGPNPVVLTGGQGQPDWQTLDVRLWHNGLLLDGPALNDWGAK